MALQSLFIRGWKQLSAYIRLTARAERYCGGEPLIQLLLDDVAKERCREWIEEICNSQAKKINE